jgi:DNA-binding FadR family transcriptional regulator
MATTKLAPDNETVRTHAPREELKSDRVVRRLEAQILSGELGPGERLPTESDLCDLLGVSRSVVRDAMRTLSARGLVTVRQGHGMSVAEPDNETFNRALLIRLARSDLSWAEVAEARKYLETGLIPVAAERGTDEDWDRLEDHYNRFAAAVERRDWDTAEREHVLFHQTIVEAMHHPALELFLRPVQEVIMATAVPPRRNVKADWEVETHPPIIKALRARDSDAAVAALSKHFTEPLSTKRYARLLKQPFHRVLTEASD